MGVHSFVWLHTSHNYICVSQCLIAACWSQGTFTLGVWLTAKGVTQSVVQDLHWNSQRYCEVAKLNSDPHQFNELVSILAKEDSVH